MILATLTLVEILKIEKARLLKDDCVRHSHDSFAYTPTAEPVGAEAVVR